MLSRTADHLFWMARYMERAENLARIIDVNETFARDEHGAANWLAILQINADEERFRERHPSTDGASVIHFYVLDPEFGPGFIKLCTYFPYPAKVWLNGHQWAKRQAAS